MFTIGDFARHGRVSVRMLRHYDAIGLLRPARVDPASGYRYYAADQLARLNRIIALKDLGFTLATGAGDPRRAGRAPRSCAACCGCAGRSWRRQLAAAAARLAQVEARLRMIESEGRMPTETSCVKRMPAGPGRRADRDRGQLRPASTSARSSSRCTTSCARGWRRRA